MQTTDYLTILNILVAFLGVLFVVFTLFEWQALRRIRKDFSTLERRLRAENHAAMKAAHRVISSYAVKDIDARIALLESAATSCPSAFNVYNALGYAWLEKGEQEHACDAFRKAIEQHPDDKAGYCDLAYAYLAGHEEDLAVRYFRKAVEVDSSAVADLRLDARLTSLRPRIHC